ncbi:hypothetical protein A4X09_0g2076 [Tilletia walkeri]|uniref:Uncharacterized protein n=1 Tax=Tilletia walkeri TaxID=117179 RepID=A0A8X7NDY6_9BASI|nr:hypothetical protein A4X09_0g2076 [Tilletia walkeri]
MANTSSESPPVVMETPSPMFEKIMADVLAAATYMCDPGCDDSSLFLEDHPDYREYTSSDISDDLRLPFNTPVAIRRLCSSLKWLGGPSSKAISEGREIGIKILKLSEDMASLRHEGRWFVRRAFAFLGLVKAEMKDSSPLGVPGTLQDLCVRSIVQDMREFHELVEEHNSFSTVMRSRQRRHCKMTAARRTASLKRTIRAAEIQLGLISKMRKMASAANGPSTASAMTLRSIKRHFKRNLSMCNTLMTIQADSRLAEFPPLEMHLQLTDFFRAIQTIHTEAEEINGHKRMRDGSDAHQDGHEMLEQQAEPELATASDDLSTDFLIPLLRRELELDRMAFESITQLNECKSETRQQLESMFWNWSEDEGILVHEHRFAFLQCLCILSARVRLAEEAVAFGELLVLMYREEEERMPSIKNKVILAAALGALSVLLAPTSRKLAAILAAEEGVRIISPIFNAEPTRYHALRTALKAVNATALLHHEDRMLTDESKIRQLRKAFRIAGGPAARPPQQPVDLQDLKLPLAGAFRIQALAAKGMIKMLLKHQAQHQHPRFPLITSFAAGELNDTSTHYRYSKYLDGLVENLTVDIGNTFVFFSLMSLQLYRDAAQKVPHLFEPLLGEAILLKAQLLNIYSPRASDALREATTFYNQLSIKFPHQFDEAITRTYSSLAKRQRWDKDLEGAADSYAIVLQHVLKPFEQAEHYTATQLKQWKRAAKLNIDRPIICIQLERYEEGIADLERSRTFFDGAAKDCFGAPEELAVRGCCFWLLGRSEEALKILKSALQLVHNEVNKDSYQEYGLALGWQGAIKSAMGDHQYALKDGEHAVRVLRNRLSNTETRLSAQFALNPFERMLPHHLVLLAGTQLAVGLKEEAMEHVEESLKLNSDIRVDGSTVKTALLLKARLLEEKTGRGNVEEAARIREEAEKIPFRGFLHRMGCSIGQTRLSRRNSFSK